MTRTDTDDTISPLELAALAESIQDSHSARLRESENDGGAVVLRYDLVGAAASPRHSLPALDLVHERYARTVGKELERATRTASRVVAERPLVVKFAEIYGGLKAPSCLIAVDVVGIGTTGLLIIDPRLFYYIYEVMLGGDGLSVDVIDENVTLLNQRGFTPAEERILRQMVELLSEAQRVAWQDILGVRLKFVRAQVDPRHAAIMSPSELVLESPLTVEIGGLEGAIRFIIPLTSLRPLEKHLTKTIVDAGNEPEDGWTQRMGELLLTAPVAVVAELGRTTMTLRELLSLKVGDLLRLSNDPSTPIPLFVEGMAKYEGLPTVHQGNFAVRLSGKVSEDSKRAPAKSGAGDAGREANGREIVG